MPETLQSPIAVEYIDGRRHMTWLIDDTDMTTSSVYTMAVPTFFLLTLLEAATTAGKTVQPALRVGLDPTAPDVDLVLVASAAAQVLRYPGPNFPLAIPIPVFAPANRLYVAPVISASGHAKVRMTLVEGHQ